MISDLTKRELETLRLIAKGKSNPSIAQELDLSRVTIDRRISEIYPKLGLFPEDKDIDRRVFATILYRRYMLATKEGDK